jgi:hypothetical protein
LDWPLGCAEGWPVVGSDKKTEGSFDQPKGCDGADDVSENNKRYDFSVHRAIFASISFDLKPHVSPAADHAPNLWLRTAKKNAVDSLHIKCPLNSRLQASRFLRNRAAFKALLVARGGTASLAHGELQKDPQLCREPEPPRAWPGFALETR